MKPIAFMNGWTAAPRCWRRYLLQPIGIDRADHWISVSVFGFVWFFERRPAR